MKINDIDGFLMEFDRFDSGFRLRVQKYVYPDPQIHHPIDLSWYYDNFKSFCPLGHSSDRRPVGCCGCTNGPIRGRGGSDGDPMFFLLYFDGMLMEF